MPPSGQVAALPAAALPAAALPVYRAGIVFRSFAKTSSFGNAPCSTWNFRFGIRVEFDEDLFAVGERAIESQRVPLRSTWRDRPRDEERQRLSLDPDLHILLRRTRRNVADVLDHQVGRRRRLAVEEEEIDGDEVGARGDATGWLAVRRLLPAQWRA